MAAAKKDAKKTAKTAGAKKSTTTAKTSSTPSKSKQSTQKPLSSNLPAWMVQGKDALERRKQHQEAMDSSRARKHKRFFLKADESAKLVFLDDPTLVILEHHVWLGKGKGMWFVPCLQESGEECPVCNSTMENVAAKQVMYFSVIDTRRFEFADSKTGEQKIVQNRKLLYPAKGSTPEMLHDLSKTLGGLTGRVIEVKRYGGGTSPNCGNSFTPVGKSRFTAAQIEKKFGEGMSEPIDYLRVFQQPTDAEYKEMGFEPDPYIIGGSHDNSFGEDTYDEGVVVDEDDSTSTETSDDDDFAGILD